MSEQRMVHDVQGAIQYAEMLVIQSERNLRAVLVADPDSLLVEEQREVLQLAEETLAHFKEERMKLVKS